MQNPPPATCSCGAEHFERVIVNRPRRPPYITEFICCVECRVMYFCPEATAIPAIDPHDWAERYRRMARGEPG